MIGRVYLERGQPVTVLARWAAQPARGAEAGWLSWLTAPRQAPRNVLIERAGGQQAVRPFRGLRTPAHRHTVGGGDTAGEGFGPGRGGC